MTKKTCHIKRNRCESIESGHVWIEVVTACGEDVDTDNNQENFWDFCPYCGGEMLGRKQATERNEA